MRRRTLTAMCLMLLFAWQCAGAQQPMNDALRHDIDMARERVYPALVNITVVYRYFADGRAQRAPAGGSGVIISPDGYTITNYHVAGHTTHIVCTLTTGERIEARDIYDDPLADLSVLKLRLEKRSNPKAPIHYAALGNSDRLRVGDFVMAMGNPLMLSSSLTLGVVSNTQRVFTDFTGTKMEDVELDEGEVTGLLTRWIQHDSLILPGNSGGPLVNLRGEVVGINELGGGGVGFAIPSNIVAHVFQQVIRYGKVIRGWLGIEILPVNKLGRHTGALISSVTPGSPSAKAGIQPGDIVLSLGGSPANVEFWEQVPLFYQQIARLSPGSAVPLKLLRKGAPLTLTATVAEMKPMLGQEEELRELGLTVRGLTPMMALKRHLPDTNGVLVTGVRPGYPVDSAQPKLIADDVIRTVNDKPVPDVAALRTALKAGKDVKQLVISYLHEDQQRLTVVKLTPPDQDDDSTELPHAWIGIQTQVLVPDVAEALKQPDTKGYLITEVYPYTRASEADLKVGDIITALNGSALDASRPQDEQNLAHAVEDLTVGDKATLTVLRSGTKRDIAVTLEATPTSAAQAKSEREKEFDFAVRDLTLFDKIKFHWRKNQAGVLVTETETGGWASVAGLQSDDLILSINGRPVSDIDSFKRIMQTLLATRPKMISIFVRRNYLTHFVFIEPDWSHLTSSL